MESIRPKLFYLCLMLLLPFLSGCNPTVKVQAPDKPITVNLNVNVKHDVQVKVDKDLETLMTKDKNLF